MRVIFVCKILAIGTSSLKYYTTDKHEYLTHTYMYTDSTLLYNPINALHQSGKQHICFPSNP